MSCKKNSKDGCEKSYPLFLERKTMGKKKKHKIIGVFRKNEKGFGFVEFEETEKEDVFVPAQFISNALNGDLVEIQILSEKKAEKRAEAKIVKVLKREKEIVIGTFQKNKNFGFVVPDDKKLGTDLFISKNHCQNARNNDKVVAKILKYPEKGKNAEGEIIEILGNVNEAGMDLLSVIKEFDLPNEFPEPVLKEATKISQTISEKEVKNRVDLREKQMHIFTIDGEDAKDLDDAIWVGKANNGNYLLDVHIADVSHYVKKGSNLDNEAIFRGTSVYMFDRVIPMLPVELSNGICSLNAGQDRFALSCLMEIDAKGKVVASDVYKSVIRVTQRMSYTDVNKIITNSDEEILQKYEPYLADFKLMEELAHVLKNRRIKAGYLNLDIPESKLILDKNGKCIDVKKYQTNFANEIIEQFMLTANETIAEKFYWLEYPFIYRVHEEPDLDKVKELNKFLWNFGYKIHINQEAVHPTEFSKVLEQVKGKPEEKVISNLMLRTLKLAKYEKENKGHFGIASKFYCHFTSPIRRYPDLFIHRMISEYCQANAQLQMQFQADAEKYAKSSSECEMRATKAEREAEAIKKAEFMEDKIGEEYEAIVSSITPFGMFAELENTVEGLIRFEQMGDEYYIYDEDKKQLIGEHTHRIFKIGDSVKIRVIEASKALRRIDFALVEEDEQNLLT